MNRSALMLGCMLTRSDIRSKPEEMAVVCSTSKAAIIASPLQLRTLISSVVLLVASSNCLGISPSQMGNPGN